MTANATDSETVDRGATDHDATNGAATVSPTTAEETPEGERDGGRSTIRTWLILTLVLGSLVGVPAVVLAETELRLLSTTGLPRQLTLGVLALVPAFALGGLSLVVMTGWEPATRR